MVLAYIEVNVVMNKRKMPSEQEQFISIKNTKLSEGKPLTIRTLDVGNDKKFHQLKNFFQNH